MVKTLALHMMPVVGDSRWNDHSCPLITIAVYRWPCDTFGVEKSGYASPGQLQHDNKPPSGFSVSRCPGRCTIEKSSGSEEVSCTGTDTKRTTVQIEVMRHLIVYNDRQG
ncbi:hypothetical protein CY34DRAFT_747888 [Suillus luteus UH-Slu-Lm8-n1]|uniref:Uncharacterized protein n=1 Tax=Suillus luteus UH-Slu-Lm8-n1 TaxID=930992 RepID=A0A0D0B9E3_9AGAM|nr:hypothetical protein CY34DRAFT_747888 [Suillus luteus UH-Slu-Lm8-n1]